MSTVLLIIQLIISLILTGLILIQRSEGGALGIGGGGGGGGGFMSGKSAVNSVSRMTGLLGAAFIINCLLITIVLNKENQNISLIDDTNAVESLTIDPESVETPNPLGDDVLKSETDIAAGQNTSVTQETGNPEKPKSSEKVTETPEDK